MKETSPELAGLASGTVEVVCNYGVLTEGWDSPVVSCAILARPTKHHGLFRQMVGRVLRPAPGKADALVLDHAGAVFEHGFIEEPVKWTLSPSKRAENPRQTARAKSRAPALTTCPECAAVRWEGHPCPACKWRPTRKPEAVDVADGDLGLVQRDRRVIPTYVTDNERQRFYRQLLGIAQRRGYSAGFAFYKFQYPGDQSRVTINLNAGPNDYNILQYVGFKVYGPTGRQYVVDNYSWPAVLGRFEAALEGFGVRPAAAAVVSRA